MSKTSVGVFATPVLAEAVAEEIRGTGVAPGEVRLLSEPQDMPVNNVLSTPGIDFSLSLSRELVAIGASEPEAQAYVDAVRQGGALVFATGTEAQVDGAAAIMNRHNAAQVKELSGVEPLLPVAEIGNVTTLAGPSHAPEGARIFTW
jgi:hypothetical protein